MGSGKPKDPCIKICKIDRDTHLCRGCLRTREEIRGWKGLSREERTHVLEAIEVRRRADAAPTAMPPVPHPKTGPTRWRHRKSGDVYEELHRGLIERDLTPVVVYRGEDGRVWVRPARQFDDGRFEPA